MSAAEAVKPTPTPGPWFAVKNSAGYWDIGCVEAPYQATFASVHENPFMSGDAEANARLIAEAGTVLHETGMSPQQLLDALTISATREWVALEKARQLADEVERLRVENLRLAKFIVRQPADTYLPDHACAQCRPHSDLLREGFVCVVHTSCGILALAEQQP